MVTMCRVVTDAEELARVDSAAVRLSGVSHQTCLLYAGQCPEAPDARSAWSVLLDVQAIVLLFPAYFRLVTICKSGPMVDLRPSILSRRAPQDSGGNETVPAGRALAFVALRPVSDEQAIVGCKAVTVRSGLG